MNYLLSLPDVAWLKIVLASVLFCINAMYDVHIYIVAILNVLDIVITRYCHSVRLTDMQHAEGLLTCILVLKSSEEMQELHCRQR